MRKTFTLLACFLGTVAAMAQTTVYTTGQSYPDAWTGWSVPVTTGITGQSIMGGSNIYTFNGTSTVAYTLEIKRQFTIYSNDIDLWLSATTENTTVSIEFSTDNVSYTQIGSQVWGPGFALSTLVVPMWNPGVSTFWLKLKMAGTMGTMAQTNFNNLKIDAEITGTASAPEFVLGKSVFYANEQLQIITSAQNYNVSIFNINGQLVASELNMKSFSFEGNEPGIYFVSILHDGKRKTLKIAHTK